MNVFRRDQQWHVCKTSTVKFSTGSDWLFTQCTKSTFALDDGKRAVAQMEQATKGDPDVGWSLLTSQNWLQRALGWQTPFDDNVNVFPFLTQERGDKT